MKLFIYGTEYFKDEMDFLVIFTSSKIGDLLMEIFHSSRSIRIKGSVSVQFDNYQDITSIYSFR